MFKLTIIASLGVLLYAHDERLKDENGNYMGRGCGTEEYNEELLAQNEEWQESLDEFEAIWAERSAAIQAGRYKGEEVEMMISIPIVNHIMVPTSTPTPPSSALASQMQTLTDDYSAQNSDYTSGTPVEFRGVRSGTFGFSISTDPATATKSTNVNSFSTNNNIKFDNSGGSNVVSPNSKLNQWFGVLSGGLLGYAQFPGGNPSTDGVVNGLGTMAPSVGNPPYNLGRTATHEIGHWLNLRHIWGDNSGCTNTETISDFVIDTPPSSSSNFGCPAGVKRCSANPYTQDMYMNYMDYVEDACMVMFTELQKQRAFASINTWRGGFSPTSQSTPSPIGYKTADTEYINWVYFQKFEGDEPSDEEKCYDAYTLYYNDDLNENSDSNIHIYGCMQKTKYMNVGHLTDIYFIGDNEECKEGDRKDNQNLNEGNEGDAIYLCYSFAESTDNYQGLLDITFVKDDDTSKLDESWTVNTEQNINPNGVKLNFAMKKGTFYHDDATVQSAAGPVEAITNSTEGKYIGIGVGLALLAMALIGAVVCRYNYSKKKAMTAYVNEALANEYGATTELTKVNI